MLANWVLVLLPKTQIRAAFRTCNFIWISGSEHIETKHCKLLCGRCVVRPSLESSEASLEGLHDEQEGPRRKAGSTLFLMRTPAKLRYLRLKTLGNWLD